MDLNFLWSEKKRILGLPISFTRYSVTEDRFFKEVGLFNTNEDQTQLYKVTDITVSRTFGQKILGLGTITLLTSDPSNPKVIIQNIPDPRNVSELLNKLVEKEKKEKNVIFYESQNNPSNF